MNGLVEWQTFFVLVGSSAGALIGLQFVAIALIADMTVTPGHGEAAGAFGTPTIVHFSMALLLSGVLCAPWHESALPMAICAAVGLAGVPYMFVVGRRMRRQKVYVPESSDWLYYVALPAATYAALAVSAGAAALEAPRALFGVGAAALGLLFIGINNTWDSITYNVFVQRPAQRKAEHHRS